MTEAEMNERLQNAQDTLDTIIAQRDNALNTVAQLNARVKQLERKLASAEVATVSPPTETNGHDAEATTH